MILINKTIENKTTYKLSDRILPQYFDFYKEYCKRDNYTYFAQKGGRGSAKSSHIAICGVLDLMENPVNMLVVRRVAKTLGSSVYEHLQWAINYLGVSEYWSTKGSKTESLMLTYKPRGNRIIFRGALNQKETDAIRGIKSKDFPLCRLWIEELAEFTDEEQVDTIINSVIREELENIDYKISFSYNPPKRKHSWVNKKFNSIFINKDYFVQHSTYLDNKYISKKFIDRAEDTKITNNRKYNHQYMGEAIGSGIAPFDNLVFRDITDEEINRFDNIKQGLDWGYGVDPVSFVRMHYDKTRKKLYIFGQIYGVKMSNRELAAIIKSKGWNDELITADSAEPKSIAELKNEHGIRKITGAKKGKGSVETGEKWLDERIELIIDPIRCPDVAWEYENIDYEIDRDGNPKNRLEDKNNHSIDATRYGVEDEIGKRKFDCRIGAIKGGR